MVKQHQERKYHMFKRFYIIAAAALYFGCSLWTGLRADDAAIYVNKVPSAETPNVLFTIDTSGSMDTVVPNGTQTRIEAVKSALTDLVTTTSNLKAGLERFHYELGAPIVFPVINLDSAPDFLNGSVSVSSIDRSSDDAAERNEPGLSRRPVAESDADPNRRGCHCQDLGTESTHVQRRRRGRHRRQRNPDQPRPGRRTNECRRPFPWRNHPPQCHDSPCGSGVPSRTAGTTRIRIFGYLDTMSAIHLLSRRPAPTR